MADRARIARSALAAVGETDLVVRSFPPDTLQALTHLRRLVMERIDDPAGPYLKWALLATLRDVADVKVGWPHQRPGVPRKPRHVDAVHRFWTRVGLIADDLETVAGSATTTQLLVGDSRDRALWGRIDGSAAACVASPPYLNNFDYADAIRLELHFWGAR